MAVNPSLIEAHWAYGYQLGELGRAMEGLAHAREMLRLDPENVYRRLALPRLLYLPAQPGQRRCGATTPSWPRIRPTSS